MSANPQLREQEDFFDPALLMAGVDVCAEGLAVVESGRVIYANRAFGKTNGAAHSSHLRGRLLADLLPDGTRYLTSTDPHIGLASGPVQIEALVCDFQENQRLFQVVCIRSIRRQSSDVPPGESQQMEAIGRLSAGIAHDLNNMLAGIMLYSDLLIAGLEADGHFRRHAEAIHKAGANGVSLIQQLMTPPGAEIVAIQPLSWNQVASDMSSLLTRLVGENIEIETKFSEPLGLVSMDSGKVQRIILNLTLNARDAMPKGGKITLSTRNAGFRFANSENKTSQPVPCVEFAVTDTGTGMDKKTLERVFRPFFTTKPRSQGNGLGLTTVRSIVRQAGGEVEIESELGKGTRVTIRVPQIEVPDESN